MSKTSYISQSQNPQALIELLSGKSQTQVGHTGHDEELVVRAGQLASQFVDSQILARGRMAWKMMVEENSQASNLGMGKYGPLGNNLFATTSHNTLSKAKSG